MDRSQKISTERVDKMKQHTRNEKYFEDLNATGMLIGEIV